MRRIGPTLAALAVLAACGGAGTPSSPDPSTTTLVVRATVPLRLDRFDGSGAWGTYVAIVDGRVIAPGPITASFPGPVLPHLLQREISDAGIDAVLAAARDAGLLEGPTDLTGGAAPGAVVGHLVFVVDGAERRVVGDHTRQIACVTTPCVAPPGTPEAFAGFWAALSDPSAWLAEELGVETPYDPDRLAILLTEPMLDATLPPSSAAWPLEAPMSEFGSELPVPAGTAPARCGVVEGDDLAAMLFALRNANQLTRWTDPTGAERGIAARALLGGEPSPCIVDA